jgi:hypothetical protein
VGGTTFFPLSGSKLIRRRALPEISHSSAALIISPLGFNKSVKWISLRRCVAAPELWLDDLFSSEPEKIRLGKNAVDGDGPE